MAYMLDPKAEQYIPKQKMEQTQKNRTRNNLNNIALDILFNSVDENIFSMIKVFPTTKEVYDELMHKSEGDDQEKDNKLALAMKKFNDFKQLPNESIENMHARFLKIIGKIRGLGNEIPQKDICLKVLRGLPLAWNMKVTAM